MCNVLGHIACPALSGVEGNHPQGRRILAAQDIVDDCCLIHFGFVGFDIRAAQTPEVIQDEIKAVTSGSPWSQKGIWVRITLQLRNTYSSMRHVRDWDRFRLHLQLRSSP